MSDNGVEHESGVEIEPLVAGSASTEHSLSDLSDVETEVCSEKDANPEFEPDETDFSIKQEAQQQPAKQQPPSSFFDESLVLSLVKGKGESWEDSPALRSDLAAARLFSIVQPPDIQPPPGLGRLWVTRAVLSTSMEPVFKSKSAPNAHIPTTMAASNNLVALGTTTGAVHMLMQSKLRTLEDHGTAPDVVTAVGIGQYGNKFNASTVLIAGHASGGLTLWQVGPVLPTKLKTLTGLHAAPVTAIATLNFGKQGAASNWALSADAHGRIVCHNIGLLLHSNAAVQALAGLARQWTGAAVQSSPSFLLPIEFEDGSNVRDCGSILSLSTLSPLSPLPLGEQEEPTSSQRPSQLSAFVLIVATQVVAIATVNESPSPSTSLRVLHTFHPPSPGAVGYAAWQHVPGSSDIIIAVGWSGSYGHDSNIVNVYLLANNQITLLVGIPVPRTSDASTLCGLAFFESGPLTILAASGEASLDVAVCHPALWQGFAMDEAIDTLCINDWMVSRQQMTLITDGASSYHAAVAVLGDRVLIMTSRGVMVVCLLTWRQGIAAVLGASHPSTPTGPRLSKALLRAVKLHRASFSPLGMQENGPSWPSDRARLSEKGDLDRQIISLLTDMVSSSDLTSALKGGGLQDVVITTCCATGQEAALFDELAPRFLSEKSSSSRRSTPDSQGTQLKADFFRGLEDAVLRGELNRIAPELMQALVEHEVAHDRLDILERTVLRLDLLSLDLNQLIPLCIKHRLYGALIRIFDGAMQDYASPAALLLLAACQGSSVGNGTFGLLLAYLRGCLVGGGGGSGGRRGGSTGGAGGEEEEAMFARMTKMRYQAASFLLHASTQAIHASASTWTDLVDGECGECGADGRSADAQAFSLHDPSPALRFLCQSDIHSTLSMLRQGLAGWDALESEVRSFCLTGVDVVDSQSRARPSSTTVTQAFVDRLAEFVKHGGTVDNLDAAGGVGREGKEAILEYVAEMASSGRVEAPPSILICILDHLSKVGDEGAFTQVLRNGVFEEVDVAEKTLMLAREAGFARAEAKILGARGRHGEAVDRLLTVPTEKGKAADVFEYIREVCQRAHLDTPISIHKTTATNKANRVSKDNLDMAWLLEACRPLALVRVDPLQTAVLVEECFPRMHSAMLSALEPWEDEQFAYLHALYGSAFSRGNLYLRGDGGDGDGDGDGDGVSKLTLPEEMERKTSSLYVRLLCRYDPDSVLPFLEAHDTYDIDSCLRHCMEANVWQATAFLLERRGEVSAALSVYLEEIKSSNDALISVDNEEKAEKRCRMAMEAALSACSRISLSDPLHHHAKMPTESMAYKSWVSVVTTYIDALMSIDKGKGRRAREILESLLEAVLSVAAGHIAAQDLARVMMSQNSSVGDVKGIVTGLVEACAFERDMLRRSAKITGDDALGALKSGHRAGTARHSL